MGTYTPPTEEKWKELGNKLRAPLSPALKDQLSIVSMMLAVGSPAAKPTLSAKRAEKEIDLWQRRTNQLRKLIWSTPAKPRLHRNLTRDDLIARFQSVIKASRGFSTHLALLASALDAAVLASEYVIQKITSPKYPGTRDHELWMVWVALVITFLLEHGVPVTRRTKRREELDPRFVAFMEGLQKTLPPSCQSRNTRETLFKGIREARELLGQADFDTLFMLMVGWGALGYSEFGIPEKTVRGDHPLQLDVFLAHYQKRLKSLQLRRARKFKT